MNQEIYFMLLKAVVGVLLSYIAYRLMALVKGYYQYKRMCQSGVVFPNGFSYTKDLMDLIAIIEERPTCFDWSEALKRKLGVSRLPQLVG